MKETKGDEYAKPTLQEEVEAIKQYEKIVKDLGMLIRDTKLPPGYDIWYSLYLEWWKHKSDRFPLTICSIG